MWGLTMNLWPCEYDAGPKGVGEPPGVVPAGLGPPPLLLYQRTQMMSPWASASKGVFDAGLGPLQGLFLKLLRRHRRLPPQVSLTIRPGVA